MSLSECIRCGGFIPLGPNATNCCTRCGFHIFGEQPDWKARAEKAEAEIERMRKQVAGQTAAFNARHDEIEQARSEVERLRALCADHEHAIRWLAKYQHDLNHLRYKLMALCDEDHCQVREGLIGLWPMVQGIRANIMLSDIGSQTIDCDAAFRSFKRLAAAGRGEG